MAQPAGQYEFKWKEPTSFSLSQTDWRSTVMRAARRGIVETPEYPVEQDPSPMSIDNIDEQLLYDNLRTNRATRGVDAPYRYAEFPVAGHSVWWGDRTTFDDPVNPDEYSEVIEHCVHPWMLCDNVDMVRDVKNKRLFHINATYSTPGGIDWTDYYDDVPIEQTAIPIPLTVSEYPYIRRRIWGEEYKPIFEKTPDSLGASRARLRLPTGTLFAEPFMRRHPTRTYIQLQYEEFEFPIPDLESIIDERLFAVNATTFQGNTPAYQGPNGQDPETNQEGDLWGPPPRWMITDIQYEKVYLPFTQLVGDIELRPAFLFQYRIEHSNADGGWMDRRGLVDKHFLATADDLNRKEPHTDNGDQTTLTDCLLNVDGTRKDDQAGPPDYKDFEVQPRLSFSFLRDN